MITYKLTQIGLHLSFLFKYGYQGLIVLVWASLISCEAQKKPLEIRKISQLPEQITESSGILACGSNFIWSHEDSGNDNKLYGFDTLGNLKRTIVISNVENIDWEDLTTDSDGNIYIADLGNNNNNRKDLAIYKIPNPENYAGSQVQAEILAVSYADQTAFPPPSHNQNFDVEAIVWRNGYLYLFTKDRSQPFSGLTKMYKMSDQPGTYLLQPMDSFYAGSDGANDRITSADYNRGTGELILLTHNRLISFTNYTDDHFFDGTITEYYFAQEPGQNEAIGFIDSRRLYMTEEGSGGESGNLYQINLPGVNTSNLGLNASQNIRIYPNPSNQSISVSTPFEGSTAVRITDALGNTVLNTNIASCNPLNISNLTAGVYYFSISLGCQTLSRRFIKQ
jgi:hypothetical protein